MHSHRILPAERLVILEFSGTIDYQDLMDCLDGFVCHPNYSRDFDGIADFRKAQTEMTPEKVRAAAALVAADQRTVGRWAILMDEPRGTALATLYVNTIGDQHPLTVFSTIEAASKYLHQDLSKILAP